ncbi:hypothetical protein BD626DRAFT_479644 [Schizophyllum amplum]|uniref:Uncharacterized protein n=1 Tax=Schizophyllum amplum TaxID=97359 RepID=A0A550CSG0_9AGAR|nr:hypothetical protein BD626DRAFT_479644 [Auriculariopsis ampla]
MNLSNFLLTLALAVSVAAFPLDGRGDEVEADRENCLLKDAQNHAGECTSQTAQQCWDSTTNSDDICTYKASTKRCSNGTLMRGASAAFACMACQCSAR